MQRSLCLLLLLSSSLCLTSTPTFMVTDDYIETGSFNLDTTPYYGVASWTTVQESDFDISLITARGGSSFYRAQVSLQDLNFEITPTLEFNITIELCTRTATYINVCLFSQRLNYLQTLKARYIVIDKPIADRIRFFVVYREGGGISVTNGSPHTQVISLATTVAQTGTPRIFAMMNGFNLTAPDANIKLDLKINAVYLSSSDIQFQFITTVPETIVIQSICFVFTAYNEQELQDWPFPSARIHNGLLSASASSVGVFTDASSKMQSYNTFWGLTRFNIHNQAFIDFSTSLSGTTIQASSANPFNSLQFKTMIFEFKQCDALLTPYYLVDEDLCYDICPAGYYQINVAPKECGQCSDNCLECITQANKCTSCRIGFIFNAQASVCEACPEGCINCDEVQTCNMCQDQYLLISNSCFSRTALILIIVLPLVFIVVVVIIIVWWFKRKREHNQIEHEGSMIQPQPPIVMLDENSQDRALGSKRQERKQQIIPPVPANFELFDEKELIVQEVKDEQIPKPILSSHQNLGTALRIDQVRSKK